MQSTNSLTSIHLLRGMEDIELLKEIHKMIAELEIISIDELKERYPMMLKLMDALKFEKSCFEEIICLLSNRNNEGE